MLSESITIETAEAVTFTLTNENTRKNEVYGVELEKVEEIRPVDVITRIPKTPQYIKGIMNLRGMIISVIDVKHKLGFSVDDKLNENSSVIVSKIDNALIGFLVDGIDQVTRITDKNIQSKAEYTKYVKNVVQTDDGLLRLIDLTRLIDASSTINDAEITEEE